MQVHRTANQVVPRFRCRSAFTSVCMGGLDAVCMSAAAALYYTLCRRLLVASVPSVATGRASAHAAPVQRHHLCRRGHSANLVDQRRRPSWRRERAFAARLEECAPRLPARPTCLCGRCDGGQRQPAPDSIVSPRETLGRCGEMARGSSTSTTTDRFAHCSARRMRCRRRDLDSSSTIGAVASATPAWRQARPLIRWPGRRETPNRSQPASLLQPLANNLVAESRMVSLAGAFISPLHPSKSVVGEKVYFESRERPTFWPQGLQGSNTDFWYLAARPTTTLSPSKRVRIPSVGQNDLVIHSTTASKWPANRLSLQLHPLMKIANTSHTSARQADICVSSTCAHDTGACVHVAVLQTRTATQQEKCDRVMGPGSES